MEISNVFKPSNRFNRLIYVAFVAAGILFVAFKNNTSDAIIYWGLALAFDPFDQSVKWGDRPVYQRVLLCLHLLVVFALIIYAIFKH